MGIFGDDHFNSRDCSTDGDCPCAKSLCTRDRSRVGITPLGHDPAVQPRKLLKQREIGLIRNMAAGVSGKRRADDVTAACDGNPGVFERRAVRHGYPAGVMNAVDQVPHRHRAMAGRCVERDNIGTGFDERIDVAHVWRDPYRKIGKVALDYADDRDGQPGLSQRDPRRAFEPDACCAAIYRCESQSDDTLVMVQRTALDRLAGYNQPSGHSGVK